MVMCKVIILLMQTYCFFVAVAIQNFGYHGNMTSHLPILELCSIILFCSRFYFQVIWRGWEVKRSLCQFTRKWFDHRNLILSLLPLLNLNKLKYNLRKLTFNCLSCCCNFLTLGHLSSGDTSIQGTQNFVMEKCPHNCYLY